MERFMLKKPDIDSFHGQENGIKSHFQHFSTGRNY